MLITLDVGDFMLLAAIIPLGIAALLTLFGVTIYCCCWKGKFIPSGSVSEPSSSASSNNSSQNRSSFGNTTSSSNENQDNSRRQSSLTTTTSSGISSLTDERRASSSIPGRTVRSSDQGYSSEELQHHSRVSLSSMVEEDDVFFNNVIPNQRRYSMPGPHHEDETFFRQVLPQHRRNSSPGSRPRRFAANSGSSMSSHRMLQPHRSHSHFNTVSQSGRTSHHNSHSHVSTRSVVPGVHNQQGGCFRTPVHQPGSNRRVSLPAHHHHQCTPNSTSVSHIRSSMPPTMFQTPSQHHRGHHDTVAPYMVVPCTTQATPATGGGRSRTPWTPNQHLTKWLDDHIGNA